MVNKLLIVFMCCGLTSGCALLMDEELSSVDAPAKKPSELYGLALSHHQAGNYAESKRLFHEFIGLYPNSLLFKVALYYLGHNYQMLGETREAEVFYSRVVDTYGDDDFWGAQALKRIQQIRDMQ